MTQGLLSGKIALITGAASGIGQAAALVFSRHGAQVALADIHREGGEATAARVREAGGEALFVGADVSRAEEVEALVSRAVAHYGRLDCAFNNAGIGGAWGATTAEMTEENWDRVIATNLKGVWLCMKHELGQMLKQGGGAIVNNASVAGLVGISGLSVYTASKHGVVGLTRAAALEYARAGLRINAVCPGAVLTPLVERALREGQATEEQALASQPIGRFGRPEEVAEAAAWLCSERASFMVGHAMAVDGGWVVA